MSDETPRYIGIGELSLAEDLGLLKTLLANASTTSAMFGGKFNKGLVDLTYKAITRRLGVTSPEIERIQAEATKLMTDAGLIKRWPQK